MAEEINNLIQGEGIEFNPLLNVEIPGSPPILLRTLNDYITYEVSVTVPYIDAEDSNFYPVFYCPNVKCFLLEARERHTTASAGGTLTVEKLTEGTAKGSGSSMLVSTFSLSYQANRLQLKGSTTVFAGSQLNPGDVVALRPSGTLTNLRNVTVTALFGINMKDIPMGQSASTIISGL